MVADWLSTSTCVFSPSTPTTSRSAAPLPRARARARAERDLRCPEWKKPPCWPGAYTGLFVMADWISMLTPCFQLPISQSTCSAAPRHARARERRGLCCIC